MCPNLAHFCPFRPAAFGTSLPVAHTVYCWLRRVQMSGQVRAITHSGHKHLRPELFSQIYVDDPVVSLLEAEQLHVAE